jgi:lysophospholipase L1-like esterase
MKKLIKILLINISIFAILLIILEVVLRILNIGYGSEPLENDRILHHKHPSNYTFISYNPSKEYGGFYVKYDSIGNKVPNNYDHDPQKKSIWFFGDSFTGSVQVSWENSYVGQIDSLFNYKYNAINFGVSAYSPLLYVIQLKKYLYRYPKPQMAIIQLYSNDVSEDERYKKSAKFNDKNQPVYCDGGETNWFTKLLRKLYVARTFRKIQLVAQYNKHAKTQSPEKNENLKLDNYIEESPVIDSSTRFSQSVLQIHQLLKSMGVPHYFFAIPSKYASLTGNWEVETFSKKFFKFAGEKALPVISLDKAFESASTNKKLFYNIDIHCNEYGNKVIANEIYKVINSQLKL